MNAPTEAKSRFNSIEFFVRFCNRYNLTANRFFNLQLFKHFQNNSK